MHEKGVRSVIQKIHWVFSQVLLHRSPPTPHTLPGKARRFFLEMAHTVSLETVCAAAGRAVVLSQQHYSELTLSWYQPTSPLVSEERINHFSRNTHLVLNSPTDRWLSVSGNINITGEKLIQTVYFSLCLSRKRYSSKCLKLEQEARDSPWLKTQEETRRAIISVTLATSSEQSWGQTRCMHFLQTESSLQSDFMLAL